MSWKVGDNRNLFLKLKTKLGLYRVELRTKHKDSPEEITNANYRKEKRQTNAY